MSEPVRWGVIGTAAIAVNRVLPAMQQASNARLVGVASRTKSKAEKVAAQFGANKAYGSYEELLADPEIEAVYIPLPNGLHAEWSIKAMRAGKDVLCEKPLTMNAAEARQVQQVRQETGKLTIEAFAYRFSPGMERAIEIARSGRLGKLETVHTSTGFVIRPDPNNVRLMAGFGGGAVYDIGCYALNSNRMLAGREPGSAFCEMEWSPRFDVDMSGAGVLDYGDGLRGTFAFTFMASLGTFYVAGSEGRLVAPFGWGVQPGLPALYLTVGGKTETITLEPANDYQREVEDLSRAVRGEARPRYADEPLDATMRLIDACYASYRSGKVEEV